MTTPDDTTPETPTTETTYDGLTTTVKVRDVRSYVNGSDTNAVSTSVYTKDALGRLIAVDAPGLGADAQYTYDERDNLVKATLTDPTSANRVQYRTFQYDQVGRLRLAVNPENGTVTYQSYDARGNLLSYRDARQNIFGMTYDPADRLLSRAQNGLQIISNTYDGGTGCGVSGCAGRLVQQNTFRIDGSNSVPVSSVRNVYGEPNSSQPCGVGTTAAFAGLNGRLASQVTSIQPWASSVETDYCVDALGMPSVTGFPYVYGSGRTRTIVGYTYTNGYLTEEHDEGRLMQFAKSIDYSNGGIPTSIRRGDNEQDVTYLDVRHRPADIQVFGLQSESGDPVPCDASGGGGGGYMVPWESCGEPPVSTESVIRWDSGAYAYDMAGNVTTIGSEQYYYDELSRLVHASVPSGVLTHSLDFAYDAFGNMTSQTRTATGVTSNRNYTVDWQTNRLTQRTWTLNGTVTTTPYAYDENGNVIGEGSRENVFDEQGHLRQVVDQERGPLGTYDYDASNYRVRSSANGIETYYFRDATGQVLSEYQRLEAPGTTPPASWNKDYVNILGKSFALIKNQVPSAPKRPTVVGTVGSSSVTITWDAVNEPDILGYSVVQVYRKHNGSIDSGPFTFNINAPAHSLANSTYSTSPDNVRYYVIAIDTAGNQSDPSPTLKIYPYSNPTPPTPTGLHATPGDRQVSLTWDPLSNDDLAGYTLTRSTTENGTYVTLNDYLIAGTSFVDNGLSNGSSYLSNGTEYWYQVFAVNSAGLVSGASLKAHTTPYDSAPPGKLTEVFAEADRVAHLVNITWRRGIDPDIVSYSIYRNTTNDPSSASVRSIVTAFSGVDSYAFQESATEGMTYYYWVTAHDATHESEKSNSVSARPRNPAVSPASGLTVEFSVADQGTTSDHGLPGSVDIWSQLGYGVGRNGCNVTAEDDDQMRATLQWLGAVQDPQEYRVYRKAPDEAVYTKIGAVQSNPNASTYTYVDSTIAKGQYDYFVVSYSSSVGDESGGTSVATMTRHMPADAFVRNIIGNNSSQFYQTQNKESRFATIQWSRVPEPDLVGYNLYRMCNFSSCRWYQSIAAGERSDAHTCEPVWIRLNAAPLPPTRRVFEDGEARHRLFSKENAPHRRDAARGLAFQSTQLRSSTALTRSCLDATRTRPHYGALTMPMFR